MSRPEWLKYTSKTGRKLCIKLMALGIYDNELDCDDLALRIGCTMEDNLLYCPLSDSELITYISNIPKKKNVLTSKKAGRPVVSEFEKVRNTVNELKRNKHSKEFDLIPGAQPAEVLTDTDLYIECLFQTVNEVKKQFFETYPDKIKRHPSIWFRFLCNMIKIHSPKIPDRSDYDLLDKVWTIYADLCIEVGINRTIENFQIFSGLNWKTFEEIKTGQNPACIELSHKIYNDCKNDIISGLAASFGSSPNQMFIAKSVYGLTENSIVTHVSAAQITKNPDDIPIFLEKKD